MTKVRLVATAAATAVAGIAMTSAFTAPAVASTGDGRCESTELCVYDSYGEKASDGYYDLRGGHKNFHGMYWFRGDHGYIGDDISSVKAGSHPDCQGWTIWKNVNYTGYSFHISKGVKFDFTGGYAWMYNEASSLEKWRC